jgi:hypothetical protein
MAAKRPSDAEREHFRRIARANADSASKPIAGRTRDVADVEAILAANPALDLDYPEGWARAWDVLDSWLRLRSAGPR